ncbi:Anti-silencing protein, ASF1-like protein, partial [Ostertagia ostertagi]
VSSAKSGSLVSQVRRFLAACWSDLSEGRHKLFRVDAPDPSKIPVQDLVGVTVLLLRCKYNGQEFINLDGCLTMDIRIRSWKENPPAKPLIEKLTRTVQIDDLRVTSFPIKWDENQPDEYPPEPEQGEIDEADLIPVEDPVDDEEKLEDEEEADVNGGEEVDLEESMENDEVQDEENEEVQNGDVEDNEVDKKNGEDDSADVPGDVEMTDGSGETSGNTSATENVAENGAVPKEDKADLKEADLEWELVYVGSAKSSSYDQVLDSALVGPVPEGRHKFVFAVDAPDPSKIPVQDLVGVTVLLLRCKYNGQEFINLGWFVSNDYEDPELKENPPAKPLIEKLTRTVQIDDLRVTSFPIKWDENQPDEYPPEPEQGEIDEADLIPVEDPVDDEEKLEDEEEADVNGGEEVDLEESMENDEVQDEENEEVQNGDVEDNEVDKKNGEDDSADVPGLIY